MEGNLPTDDSTKRLLPAVMTESIVELDQEMRLLKSAVATATRQIAADLNKN
jgi:hypothetical protein